VVLTRAGKEKKVSVNATPKREERREPNENVPSDEEEEKVFPFFFFPDSFKGFFVLFSIKKVSSFFLFLLSKQFSAML
jgi:hypothetical protein